MKEDYGEIMRQKGLPRVGQIVRSKRYGTSYLSGLLANPGRGAARGGKDDNTFKDHWEIVK